MSKKFKSNGIKIHYGAAHHDVSFNVKNEGLFTLDMSVLQNRHKRRVIAEIVTDWKKGRYELPLLRA